MVVTASTTVPALVEQAVEPFAHAAFARHGGDKAGGALLAVRNCHHKTSRNARVAIDELDSG